MTYERKLRNLGVTMSSDESHLRKWVRRLAVLARKNRLFSEDLLLSPCQITAIFIKEEEFMILIAKHDPKKVDLQVAALFTQSMQDALVAVDSKVLTDEYYLEQGNIVEVAGLLGEMLPNIHRFPRKIGSAMVAIGFLKLKVNDGYILVANVDPYRDKPEDLPSFKKHQPPKTIPDALVSIEPSKEKEVLYLASLWYPPVMFSDGRITLTKASVLQSEYKGHTVIFDNKSFLCILVPIAPPILAFVDKAVEIMNEIIATANILGLAGIAATKEDIVTFTHRQGSENPVSVGHSAKPTVRSLVFKNFIRNPAGVYQFHEYLPFRIITKSLMEDIIRKAENITANRDLKNYLSLFLDAATHMLAGASKAAFLHGWIIIEKYIDDIWLRSLSQYGITGRRLSKLSQSILWTTDNKLEALNLMNIIPNRRYAEIMRLKKIRNRVVHKERKVHHKEAHECLSLCKSIVTELIRLRCFIEL